MADLEGKRQWNHIDATTNDSIERNGAQSISGLENMMKILWSQTSSLTRRDSYLEIENGSMDFTLSKERLRLSKRLTLSLWTQALSPPNFDDPNGKNQYGKHRSKVNTPTQRQSAPSGTKSSEISRRCLPTKRSHSSGLSNSPTSLILRRWWRLSARTGMLRPKLSYSNSSSRFSLKLASCTLSLCYWSSPV